MPPIAGTSGPECPRSPGRCRSPTKKHPGKKGLLATATVSGELNGARPTHRMSCSRGAGPGWRGPSVLCTLLAFLTRVGGGTGPWASGGGITEGTGLTAVVRRDGAPRHLRHWAGPLPPSQSLVSPPCHLGKRANETLKRPGGGRPELHGPPRRDHRHNYKTKTGLCWDKSRGKSKDTRSRHG